MKRLIAFSAACVAQMLCARVYYNDKTFLQSETINDVVYIGDANATDGGDPANALVTVKSGVAWTNTGDVVLGHHAGTSRLAVESGASLDFGNLKVADTSACSGLLELQENAFAVVTNITISPRSGYLGCMRITGDSVVSNVYWFKLGRNNGSQCRLELEGGRVLLNSTAEAPTNSMCLGVSHNFSGGVVSGWGFVGFDNPLAIMRDYSSLGRDFYKGVSGKSNYGSWGGFELYGQVIADGKGTERDLDFSKMGVPHGPYVENGLGGRGTNGWYAINKGRLLLPRCVQLRNADYNSVGGSPFSDIKLVNSFQFDLHGETFSSMGYIFSELYATDRSDVPAGLPSGRKVVHKAAVWRIGMFDHQAHANRNANQNYKRDFQNINVKFHYDPALAKNGNVDIVKVYRCTDEKKGGWQCVGTALPSVDAPYIQTEDFGPSADLYNFGWFAIVGESCKGTTIVVR